MVNRPEAVATRTGVSFVVLGVAAPQGSKVLTKWGAMREANKRTMPWRQEVAAKAQEAMRGASPILTPVRLRATFLFPRPKSHYRTGKHAGQLKDGIGYWMTTKPDLSKLVRAAEDAMTGIVYRDDSQVCVLDVAKHYTVEEPKVMIVVETLQNAASERAAAGGAT
jgi:Holliday junction resolvase RusA-like endonuclease